MPINYKLLKTLFAFCIFFQLSAQETLKQAAFASPNITALLSLLETQNNRISRLEDIIANGQANIADHAKHASTKGIKNWIWNHKGKIVLGTTAGVIAACTLKTLYDSHNEKINRVQRTVDEFREETREQFAKVEANHGQILDNTGVLLQGINQLRAGSGLNGELAFNTRNIPGVTLKPSSSLSAGSIVDSIVHAIGNGTLSAASTACSLTFQATATYGMRAIGTFCFGN